MKIGIDLDEVVAEFARGYLKLYNLNPKKNLQYLYCSNDCVDFFGNLKTQNKPHLLRCGKAQGFVIFEVIYSGDFFNGQGKTKADLCTEKKLDVFIEDRKEYALECGQRGIRVFLLDKPWNKNIESSNITRVRDWNEILNKINKQEDAKLFS